MTDTFHAQKKQAADSRGIPADCIRLSDAFRTFVRALYPDSGGIENMHAAPLVDRLAAWREFSDVIRSADLEFRRRIAEDAGPQAYVRDPKNGERYLRPVFFVRADFKKWVSAIAAAPRKVAAPGRPPIIPSDIVESELDRWIAGGKPMIVEKLKTYKQNRSSIAAIARALEAWAKEKHGVAPKAPTIENQLREKLPKAYALL